MSFKKIGEDTTETVLSDFISNTILEVQDYPAYCYTDGRLKLLQQSTEQKAVKKLDNQKKVDKNGPSGVCFARNTQGAEWWLEDINSVINQLFFFLVAILSLITDLVQPPLKKDFVKTFTKLSKTH